MTHLLLTGGLGFIGSHIVEQAIGRGWTVTVIDSLRSDVHATTDIPNWFTALDGNLDLIVADAGDASPSLLKSVDIVCHQAAKVGLGVDFTDAPDYVESNVAVTARLLAAMTNNAVRNLVLASSMVVYGEGLYRSAAGGVQPQARTVNDLRSGRFEPTGPDGEQLEPILISETDATDPRNVYAVSKLAQEHLSQSWARATGGRVVALRYHNVFGSRMPTGTPYAGVASLFRTSLANNQAPQVFEDGNQRRDFVDVRDVASANLAAMDWVLQQHPGIFRAFNVGSGTVRTIGQFAWALAEAMGGPKPVVTGEFRLGDVRHITASSDRIASELGWRARQDWADAIREFSTAPARLPVQASDRSRAGKRRNLGR